MGILNLVPPVNGTPRTTTQFAGWWNQIMASVNNIIGAQITNNTIPDTKLQTITTGGKVNSSALTGTNWTDLTDAGVTALHTHSGTVASHGDLSADSSTMHTAQSSITVDAGAKYAASSVEGALQEVATFVGMTPGSGSIGTTKFIGESHDTTSPITTGVTPSCTVVIPPGTVINGVLLQVGTEIQLESPVSSSTIEYIVISLRLKINSGGFVNLTTYLTINQRLGFSYAISEGQYRMYADRTININASSLALADIPPTINWATDTIEIGIAPLYMSNTATTQRVNEMHLQAWAY